MHDPNTAPWQARAKLAGWAASASLPLHRNGIVAGVFILYANAAGAFDEPERKLLVEMAGDISFALDNFDREMQRRRTQEENEFINTIFRMQQDTSPDAILVVNSKAEIIFYNQRFIDLWQLSPQLLNAHADAPILNAVADQVADAEAFVRRVQYLYEHCDEKSREEIQMKDGRTLDRYSAAITGADGKYDGRVWYFRDITERKQAADKIEHLAFYDPLTSLPNRRLLRDRLRHSIAASERHQNFGAVLFLDLDNFKVINDSKGHDIGDLLLVDVAQRLQACVREGDTVARLGGDEFIVILEKLSEDREQAAAQTSVISDKILVALSQPYLLATYEYLCSVSIGISLFRSREATVGELLKRADTAMYQAKSAGRNTRRFYDPALQATLEARTALEADLRSAQSKNQLSLYYQKQVDHTGRVFGAEVLVRWQHPVLGMISPLQFIPLAEETGLILPIGQWVLETACARLKAWEADPHTRDLKLAVNVSARQFHHPDFIGQVQLTLRNHGFNTDLLKLELTESVVLNNIGDTVTKMHALRQAGVRFSLDDFGTGYSSLSYLTQLPLDQIKIDQSFVRNIGQKHNDSVMVQTIIGMAHNLGMEVIAEGVETEEQRTFLEQHGCALCQGYLFGRPVPVEEFEAELKLLQ
jgi:diguanylate cyclase (GGDEF)-like protein